MRDKVGPEISPRPSWKNKKASMRKKKKKRKKSSQGKYVLEVYTDGSGKTTEIEAEFESRRIFFFFSPSQKLEKECQTIIIKLVIGL